MRCRIINPMPLKDLLKKEMGLAQARLRLRKPLSQYKLAQLSGVTQPTISRILKGGHVDSLGNTVEKLAQGLQIPPSRLMDEDAPAAPQAMEFMPRVQHERDLIQAYRVIDEDAREYIWSIISRETERIANNPYLSKLLKRVSREDRLRQDRALELGLRSGSNANAPPHQHGRETQRNKEATRRTQTKRDARSQGPPRPNPKAA